MGENNMEFLNPFFKSIIDQDNTSIVICDLNHTIIYMNKTAITSYEKRGGDKLIGRSLMACHNDDSKAKIEKVISWFKESECNNRVHTFFNEKQNKDGYMVALRDDMGSLIGYYEKHEFRDRDETPFYNF